MIKYTTPSWTFVKPTEAAGVSKCIVTFSQHNKVVVEKNLEDLYVEGNKYTVELTQEESGLFEAGEATMQVNFLTSSNRRLASNEHKIRVYENGKSEVI
ncbi:MAG: hypothetical protein MJZ12_01655 [Prevotella sp.]|nr:hypothetical protein [Prevotella sp.]